MVIDSSEYLFSISLLFAIKSTMNLNIFYYNITTEEMKYLNMNVQESDRLWKPINTLGQRHWLFDTKHIMPVRKFKCKENFLSPACQLWSESGVGWINFSVVHVSVIDNAIQNEVLTLFGCTFPSWHRTGKCVVAIRSKMKPCKHEKIFYQDE